MHLTRITAVLIILMSFNSTKNSCQEINSPAHTPVTVAKDSILHYLALGDSYTIGTSVAFEKSFPSQLSVCLEENFQREVKLEVIAKAGWRTDNLQNVINLGTLQKTYNLVTLLIGVNNQYQKKPFSQYKKEFPALLEKAIKLANSESQHVFVISIPDWAYTPFGANDGRKNISKKIDIYNSYAKETTEKYGANYINITDLTRKGLEQPNLVAKDGLHPSREAYQLFVERICPVIDSIFKKN